MSRRKQIRGLNALRTLALFGVLLFHMFPQAVPGGYFGVILFFVISGFLTAYSTDSEEEIQVLPYYLKRLKRIYPALIIMLFVSIEAVALTDRYRLAKAYKEIASVVFGYNNYWQITQSADYFANLAANSAFTHLWYIAILIQFELLWPWLSNLTKKYTKKDLLGIITIVSLFIMPVLSFVPSLTTTMLYYGTLSRIHALLLGAWAGRAFAQETKHVHIRPALSVSYLALFTAVTVLIYLKVDGQMKLVYHIGMVLYAFACLAAVWLLCDDRNPIGVYLDKEPFAFFSKYSYEIYLWQYPVLVVFGSKGLSSAFWHYLLQAAVIIILSMWTHWFTGMLNTRKPAVKKDPAAAGS